MGKKIKKLDLRKQAQNVIKSTVPPSSNISRWYDPLDNRSSEDWNRLQQMYYNQSYSSELTYDSGSISPNYGGSINIGGGAGGTWVGGGASVMPSSVGDLYGQGWLATREACPNCGAGMLVQNTTQQYWCTICCQKYTAEGLHETKKRAVETVLDWLDRQINKYTKK